MRRGKATVASDGGGTRTGFPRLRIPQQPAKFFLRWFGCNPASNWRRLTNRILFHVPTTQTTACCAPFVASGGKSIQMPVHEPFTHLTALSQLCPVILGHARSNHFLTLTDAPQPAQDSITPSTQNDAIPDQIRELYDSRTPTMASWRDWRLFAANQLKCLSMCILHVKTRFHDQGPSSPIKLNQGDFLKLGDRHLFTPMRWTPSFRPRSA